jgi:signal transduction histidine kinase
MRPDPRTFVTVFGFTWMLVSALSTAIWWIRYRRLGFGRWTGAGLAFLVSFLLASRKSRAPEWMTVVCANNALVVSAILYLEGAREFRGLSPRRWLDYLGGLATMGALAFFVYAAPNPNVRTVMGAAYVAIMYMLTAVILWRGTPSSYTFAPRLAGGLFVLSSATLLARIGYLTLGSSLNDFFTMTMANRTLLIGGVAEWSLLPIGFFLLADERGISELRDAKQQASMADAKVTQHKAAEAVLSTLSGRLMEAQEQERARIARELHDDLAQRMAMLKIQLDDLGQELPIGTSAQGRVRHISNQATKLAHDIQVVAQRLHSASLELLGLSTAAANLCRELAVAHRVAIDFSTVGIPDDLSRDIALCLYRVLQEALSNALKHAGVPRVTVMLRGTSTDIRLDVIDEGKGFDPETLSHRQGLGLISMRERLNLVTGDLHVQSRPSAGTTVRVRVPLNYREPESAVTTG